MVAMNVWPTDGAAGSVANEARWRSMARQWSPSAVMAGVGGQLAPSLAYPNLTVQTGAAWVDGHYCELTSSQVLTVTANGLAVVRFDPAANTAELLYRDGISTPTQSPTGTWELPVAKITGSALQDARLIDTTAGLVAPTYAALKAGVTTPRDGMRVGTLDDGRLYIFRAAATTYSPGPGTAPANRWESSIFAIVQNKSSDATGLFTVLPSEVNLDGFIQGYADVYWAAAAAGTPQWSGNRWVALTPGGVQVRVWGAAADPGNVQTAKNATGIVVQINALGYRL